MFRGYRSLRLSVVILLAVAILAPVAVSAAGGHFTDDDDSIFEAHIEWMADSAITLGCNPPTNDNYCPDDSVTRGQMAAFMHRLADNQVVDAGELGGQDPGYYQNMFWASDVELGPLADPLVTESLNTAELAIDAPYDGYLLINASASIHDLDSTVQTLWWVQIDNSTCTATTDSVTQVGLAYASVYATQHRQSASISGGVAVTAGNHTVTLCGNALTLYEARVYGPSLTVLFTTAGTVDM